MHTLSYEDCGVRGGRVSYKDGTEFYLSSDSTIDSFGIGQLYHLRDYWAKSRRYRCERLCICLITIDKRIRYYYFADGDIEKGRIRYFEETIDDSDAPYSSIGSFLVFYGAQAYDIMQQISADVLRSLEHREKMDGDLLGNAYDLFRCLDLFGPCNAPIVEHIPGFHDYQRFYLGEGFYLEKYDDPITKRTEFWICRFYSEEKYLLTAYSLDDRDYMGWFDEQGRFVIDPLAAKLMCKLTDKREYLFIDNEYNLTMHAIDIDNL